MFIGLKGWATSGAVDPGTYMKRVGRSFSSPLSASYPDSFEIATCVVQDQSSLFAEPPMRCGIPPMVLRPRAARPVERDTKDFAIRLPSAASRTRFQRHSAHQDASGCAFAFKALVTFRGGSPMLTPGTRIPTWSKTAHVESRCSCVRVTTHWLHVVVTRWLP
jgi:hypothetical protein